jgi:hypothetical protein
MHRGNRPDGLRGGLFQFQADCDSVDFDFDVDNRQSDFNVNNRQFDGAIHDSLVGKGVSAIPGGRHGL